MAFYNELLKYGDAVALINNDGELRYAELDAAAKGISAPVPKRSLVFCLCKNCFASVAGYLGFLQQGVVPALIDSQIDAALYKHLYVLYQPQFVWAEKGFAPGKPIIEFKGYALVATEYSEAPLMDKDLALLLTTSGSTGSPKFVRQTYSNICANTESIVQYLGIRSEDRAITTLPMNYTYGLSIIQTHLHQGAALIMTESTLMDKTFWQLLREKRATTFGGVPYTFEMLKRLRFLRMEGLSLRYLTQAGGKLGKDLHHEFATGCKAKGIDFVVMYGATEATARMSYLPSDVAVEKAGSIGIPIPGGRFALIDDAGTIITTPYTTGELVYYGENVTPGYAEKPEDLASGDMRNGCLLTGDLAQVDDDGYYYIVGRKKRFLKMFGNRTNLDEVEELLNRQGYENACVGIDDHMRIFTTEHDIEKVRVFIAETLGIHLAGFVVQHINALPRNEAGKLLYSVLEQYHD